MPELVEAQIMVDGLKQLIGKRIDYVQDEITLPNNILSPREDVINFLSGADVVDVIRRGKRPFLVVENSDETRIVEFFLSMSGAFRLGTESNVSRVLFRFMDETRLFYEDSRMWGRVKLLTQGEFDEKYATEAIDPLLSDFGTIYNRLLTNELDPGWTVKDLLMDQRVLIGLGNFYSQEILYDARIRPQRQLKDTSTMALRTIAEHVDHHVKRAYKSGGLSLKNWHHADGTLGEAQDFGHVYSRKVCKTCGTKTEKIEISGRATYYCPDCQK